MIVSQFAWNQAHLARSIGAVNTNDTNTYAAFFAFCLLAAFIAMDKKVVLIPVVSFRVENIANIFDAKSSASPQLPKQATATNKIGVRGAATNHLSKNPNPTTNNHEIADAKN